jgi:hypothetical protein
MSITSSCSNIGRVLLQEPHRIGGPLVTRTDVRLEARRPGRTEKGSGKRREALEAEVADLQLVDLPNGLQAIEDLKTCSAKARVDSMKAKTIVTHEGLLHWASIIVPPLGQSWAVEGAQEQVDRDTPVSRTPIDKPAPSQAHGLPPFENIAAQPLDSWNPVNDETATPYVKLLAWRIAKLSKDGLKGIDTNNCWISRRI